MLRMSHVRLAVLALGGLALVPLASAQVKVGIINLQAAVLETAEIKKAQADLQAKFSPRQTQMEALRKELEGIQQQLQTGAGKLTPQREAELTSQGQRRQREYQRLGEDLQGEVDRERTEILQRASLRMQEVVRKLADERQLDMVVDASTTIHFKPTLEFTKDATAAYDKAYPGK